MKPQYKIDVAEDCFCNFKFYVYKKTWFGWTRVVHSGADTIADVAKKLQEIARLPMHYSANGRRV